MIRVDVPRNVFKIRNSVQNDHELLTNQIKSNILVKHYGTVGRLKPCKIKVEGAWESGKGREQGEPC